MTSPLHPTSVDVVEDVGRWRIWAHRPGFEVVEVTYVRGIPTKVGDWTWEDPFGEGTASLTFENVSMFDRLGEGDLFWLAPEVDFDIEWVGPLPKGYPYGRFVWQGYSEPFELTQTTVTINLVGFLRQLDHYLAKPEFATSPIPYEVAISRCWRDKADLRVKELEVVFPPWWTTTYQPVPKAVGAFVPTGVSRGDKWTGLLTRETGSWDQLLTSYIQTLLSTMYTRFGRWTMETLPDRRVQLMHRDFILEPRADTLMVEPLQPGVEVSLSEDHSQKANVLYGQTRTLAGDTYSGLQVIGDNIGVTYRPLAALRQVHPVTDRNTWLDPSVMRREQQIQAQEGLDAIDLQKVGAAQLQAVSEPGLTGSITLTSDPRYADGTVVPRALIRAGMSVQLKGYRGRAEGVLLHVTAVTYSFESDTATLTVDSKYRDKLTVDEVRLRGRDALAVPRMLLTGRVQPLLPDMLVPWSYAEGSGYVPSSPSHNARRLFEDMPSDITFPYQEWTRQRPPREAAWKNCYIRIGPADLNEADKNWARYSARGGFYGWPIKMSAAGQARGIQIAAYNRNGEVMPVPFHFSIYYQRDVNVASMPKIPAGKIPMGSSFHTGDHYPFFEGAFETYGLDGVQAGIEVPQAVKSAGFIQGWGTQKVPAGHWPGYAPAGDPPTGLLVDEGTWEWNFLTGGVSGMQMINPYKYNDVGSAAGYLYCMIYCDRQLEDEVFFMGRIFRIEPGQGS